MTKDEALKHALEKFEYMNHVDSIFHGEFDFQINAIKKALAQQAEPVAWMSPNKESFVHAEDVGNSVPNWTDYYTIPLYTSPPSRQPLTDEEIWSVLQFRGYNTDTIEIAKAIEAAHGIKGEA